MAHPNHSALPRKLNLRDDGLIRCRDGVRGGHSQQAERKASQKRDVRTLTSSCFSDEANRGEIQGGDGIYYKG